MFKSHDLERQEEELRMGISHTGHGKGWGDVQGTAGVPVPHLEPDSLSIQ